MSIKIMSQIWENGPDSMTDRFVLLCIADYANDGGIAWPSIASICKKTTLSDRGVQKSIRRLEASGWLVVETAAGRKGCNNYHIKTPNTVHPEQSSPPNVDTLPPNVETQTPEHGSPEPSRTIIEPSYSSLTRDDANSDWLAFWELYPHKVGKPVARKAFFKAIKSTPFSTIIDGLHRYVNKTDDRPWCNPSTWLNQERWADQPAMVKQRDGQRLQQGRPQTDLERIKAKLRERNYE